MIRIVSVDNGLITFEKVETDTINVAEVALIETKMATIEQNIIAENKELERCREKIAFAKKVIELATELPVVDEQEVVEQVEEIDEQVEEPISNEEPTFAPAFVDGDL